MIDYYFLWKELMVSVQPAFLSLRSRSSTVRCSIEKLDQMEKHLREKVITEIVFLLKLMIGISMFRTVT